MMSPIKSIGRIALLASLLFLAACSALPSAEPTQNPNTIYTQAAETVQSQLSATAAMLPTSTPTLEPTATEMPSQTPEPATSTPEALPTQATQATQATQSTQPALPGTGTATQPAALATATTAPQKQGDSGVWASNVPADGSTVGKGEEFMLAIRITNNGTTTWTKDYKLGFMNGTRLSGVSSINLDKETKPGKVGEFYIWVYAPQEAGDYISRWLLSNPQGVVFYQVYFAFKVK